MASVTAPRLTGAAKKGRKLTYMQARFLLDCLTVNYEQRKAAGKKNLTHGLYRHLGGLFGVSPETVKDIWKRRSFKWMPIANIYTISLEHRLGLLEEE